jgi:thymidylate synthase
MSTASLHEEEQYLNLIRKIVRDGYYERTRNGNTLCTFGYSMRFNLQNGTIPFITTKKLAWKTCFRELMWFVRGSTDVKQLANEGVHIWDANSSRQFLDSRGLTNLAEGDIGPGYGHQWRHFGAPYSNCHENYEGKGVDQLADVIRALKDPAQLSSRRLLVCAWNPAQLNEMALPPCHVLMQFNVAGGKKLSCALYQRSGDVGLGVPFNIASYSFLTHMIANHCGLEADEFVYFLGNAHIYEPHLKPLMEQSVLRPVPFPRIRFMKVRENIEDYTLDDIEFLQEYNYEKTVVTNLQMIA